MNDACHSLPPGETVARKRNANGKPLPGVPPLTVAPLIDMVELPDGICFYCNLPGVGPDDVTLTVEDEFLSLCAETRNGPFRGKIHALEFCDASYVGRILLPKADTARAEASLSNGVLRIFIPFLPKTETVRIPVAAG